MLIRRSPKLLAELRASEKRELRDGKTLAATRLNYRYRRGAGNLTRSRRCWRNGAARALQPDPNPSTCHSGVRRGRAGGRQEYRHFRGPAQPSKSCRRARLRNLLVPAGVNGHQLRQGALLVSVDRLFGGLVDRETNFASGLTPFVSPPTPP